MTKVAEDYRSAPERSSHPLLAPQGSDFSRWWELEPEKTLAGLGPFAENENAEDILGLNLADDDDDSNEPTRLLARSLLQMAPRIEPEPEEAAPPRQASGLGPAESSVLLKAAAIETAAAESASGLPTTAAFSGTPTLDGDTLDELARRVSRGSVLRTWIHSSPAAALPSLPIQISRAEAPPSAPPTPALDVWRTVTRHVNRLSRTRASAAVAGLSAAGLLLLLLLSRLGGAQAGAEQLAPGPASGAARRPMAAAQALPTTPAAAFITLSAGVGADEAIVELIGDGHLRRVNQLPARIAANHTETYRVHARRPGYQDFSAELSFASGETEKNVLVGLEPEKLLPPVQGARDARAPLPVPPVSPPVARAVPSPQAKPAGETLVRVKANATPLAAGSAALSLNSIPLSTVIVDGRTQGLTPRLLQVTPGAHMVVFVHRDLGRRLVSVDVAGGTTAVAAVKF
jgi:hypothetical protein